MIWSPGDNLTSRRYLRITIDCSLGQCRTIDRINAPVSSCFLANCCRSTIHRSVPPSIISRIFIVDCNNCIEIKSRLTTPTSEQHSTPISTHRFATDSFARCQINKYQLPHVIHVTSIDGWCKIEKKEIFIVYA